MEVAAIREATVALFSNIINDLCLRACSQNLGMQSCETLLGGN